MDTRKRPANPLSRGHSPPDKRSRSISQSDRPGITRRATDPRPQYGSSLPTANQPSQHSPLHTGSVSNHGSGASTPTQFAPTAPSMLPAIFQESRAPEHANDAAVPASLASLRLLRKKKQAMAKAYPSQTAETSPIVSTVALQAQLKAAQMEISALRRQMKNLENLPSQVAELKARDIPVDDSGPMQAVLRRLENLEKAHLTSSNNHSPVIAKATEQPQLPDKLEKLTSTISRHQEQLNKIQVWMDRHGSALDGLPGLKEDIEDVKHQAKRSLTINRTNNVSLQQCESIVEGARQRLHAEVKETTTQLMKTIEGNHQAVQELTPKVTTCLDFKTDLEQHKLPLQLQTLDKRITEAEKDKANTKTLQQDLSQLSLRLNKRYDDIEKDVEHLLKKQDDAKDVADELNWQLSTLNQKVKEHSTTIGQIGSLQRVNSGHSSQISSLHQLQATQTHDHRKLAAQQDKTEDALNKLCNAHENLYEERMKLENRLMKVRDDRLDKLDHDLKSVRESLGQLSEPAFVLELRDRLSSLERTTMAASQARPGLGEPNAEVLREMESRLQADIKNIHIRMSEMESLKDKPSMNQIEFEVMRADLKRLEKIQTSFRTELEDVQSDIALTEKTINSFDKDIHEHGLAINVLESKVPTLISTSFEERLDPLQANIDHEMSTIKGYLETLNDKVIELKQQALTQQPGLTPSQQALLINLGATSTALKDDMLRLQDRIAAETNQRKDDVSELRMQALQDRKSSLHSDLTAAQSPTLATLVQNTSSLKQDLDHLQAFAAGEKDRRDHEIRSIREQLATKQETAVAERAMDVIKLGVRNLQDQYNNITTDDLHQRMAGWFLEQYPSDTANFLRRISGVEQELRRLHGHWQQVSWISLYAEPLRMLAQTGPPTNPSASNSELQKISARAKEAVDDVRVARERCEAAERRVTEHEAGVQALRTQLTDLANEERNARAEFVTKASAEHQQRVAAEAKMKASIHQLEKMMKEKTDAAMASITTTIVRVEDVEKVIKDIQMASVQLREEHDLVTSTFIHPNEDLLTRLGNMFVAVAELQQVVEGVNAKLPRDRLRINWAFDLTAGPETDGQESGTWKGKEKET